VKIDTSRSFSATVTSKMQLTIPAALARKHGIKGGDKVRIEEQDGRIILTPIEPLWLLKPFRRLRRGRREATRV
jgi:AbrB family looped-hinge helix DNA binding protein